MPKNSRVVTLLKADDKASNLHGVFTEGGWSDDGQVMVLGTSHAAQVVVVKPNSKEKAEPARGLTAAEWTVLKFLVSESTKLTDISVEAFDALIYEFAHWRKAGRDVQGV